MFDLPPVEPAILAQAIPEISVTVADRAQRAAICARASGEKVDRLAIFDANLPSTAKRFWLVDLTNDEPKILLHDWVSHGAASEPKRDGIAKRFSNRVNSHMTSLGLYRIAERYRGVNPGWSWRLDGLTPGFNDNARERAVVIHPANYIREGYAGRSLGCPALRPQVAAKLNKIGTENTMLWIDAEGHGLEKSESVSCEEALAWVRQRTAPVNPAPTKMTVVAQWGSGGGSVVGLFDNAVCAP